MTAWPPPRLPPHTARNAIVGCFLLLLAMLACGQCARAQVVHVANYSGSTFDGWKRCTVDVMPPHEAGQVANGFSNKITHFVLGRRIGVDVRVIDLRVRLEPGEIRSIDLSAATPWGFTRGSLPLDPLAFFGQPSIAGVPLSVANVQPDGAGWLVHLRARVGPMLHTDLWTTWYPDQPGWCAGELAVTASNPAVPDVTATVPDGFLLRFGAADVLIPGLQPEPTNPQGARAGGARLLPAGSVIGDGQARSWPIVLVWRQHLRTVDEWSSAGAAANLAICANGIARLYPDGNPQLAAGTAPLAWTIANWAGAIERLHTWDAGPIGVTARSPSAGAVEDQVFVGAECAGTPGLGAETVRYLVALGQSRRPCHHLEADGSLLDLARHPQLRFWDARPHWHTGVSPDQLGKSRGLTELETHGWWGPDVEHWLQNTVALAARLTGSPALQWQLAAQARVYLLQWTVAPGLSTSQCYAARAVGWEAINVVHLWRGLENRVLAAMVRERWLARLDAILLPQLGAAALDIWDTRIDDARLGTYSTRSGK